MGFDVPEEAAEDRPGRFFVRAASVNAVRRALERAPGGVRVVGRADAGLIECRHSMDESSYHRIWPIIVSRLRKAGLAPTRRES